MNPPEDHVVEIGSGLRRSSRRPDRRPWIFVMVLTSVVIALAMLAAVWIYSLAGGIAPDSQPTTDAAGTLMAVMSRQVV